jgi:acetate---CoA ligase (ADP-forming)
VTLDPFFNARHIVVVGASSDPGRVGGRPIAYLQRLGYAGRISPVNPRRDEIAGLPCYPSATEVPGDPDPDLALIAVAGQAAVDAIDACGQRGIRAAVVFTAGFGELGADGLQMEADLVEAARRHDIRICGPNTLGIISAPSTVVASFATSLDRTEHLLPGRVGLISQSGALGAFMHRQAQLQGVPIRHFVSTGNEADLTAGDYLRHIVEDEGTRAVGLYLEGVRDGQSLVDGLARARELRKPVAVVKVGRGARAREAARSHTGALAGEDEVIDAAIRQYGALRVDDIDHLLAFLYLASSLPELPRGDRLGVVSLSGGLGVWAADVAEERGAVVTDLSEQTRERLTDVLPGFASVTNPVDVTGQIVNDPGLLAQSITIVAADPAVDMVVVGMGIQETLGEEIARGICEAAQASTKPVVTAWMAGPEEAYTLLEEGGVTTFRSVGRALEAVANLASWAGRTNAWEARTPAGPRTRPSTDMVFDAPPTEFEAKRLLAEIGIPAPAGEVVHSADGARAAVATIGGPVVMKAQLPDVAHKSDLGLVELGVASEEAAAECYEQMAKRAASQNLIDGADALPCLVEGMVDDVLELILGFRHDPVFGATILLGLGGTRTELLRSFATRLAPLEPADVEALLEESTVAPMLAGFRGEAAMDPTELIDAVRRFSEFVADGSSGIAEIEINPLAVVKRTGHVVALDALIVPEDVRGTRQPHQRTL